MKFKKIVAAVSAATMLGSLVVAMPMSASAAETAVTVNDQIKSSSGAGTATVEGTSVAYASANNGIWYLGSYDMSEIESITAYTALCPDGDANAPQLKVAYCAAEGDVNQAYIDNNSAAIRNANNTLWQYTGVTTDETASVSTFDKFDTVTLEATGKTVSGTVNMFVYATAQKRRAYIQTVTIKTAGEVTPVDPQNNYATAVDLSSDAEGKTLYYGDKVTFTPVLTPADADDSVTYTFTGAEDGTDWTNQFVADPEDPNTFTYNSKDRRGGNQGRITVTATAVNGGVSGTTEIKTQRFQNIKYQFVNAAGEAVQISVVTKADGVQVDSRNITIAADADGTTANASADKRFSGNASTLTVEADVPAGYELTLENDGVYTVNGDAVIKGTLSKVLVPSTAVVYGNAIQYFVGDNSVEDTAAGFIADLTAGSTAITKLGVTVNETDVRAMQSIGTELDGEGAGILIKVIVKGVTAADTITLNID